MKFALSTVEYTKTKNEPIVHLFARNKILERWHIRVYNLLPFFCVDKLSSVPGNNRLVKVVNITKQGWKSIRGEAVKKIIMKLPIDVGGDRKTNPGFRSRFQNTYEDDIEFITRALLELNIKSGFELDVDKLSALDIEYGDKLLTPIDYKAVMRRLHIDIETSLRETSGRMPNWKNPINAVYSLSCLDSYTLKFYTFIWSPKYSNRVNYKMEYTVPFDVKPYNGLLKQKYPLSVWTFNNEIDMFKTFLEFFNDKNPDIGTGWNFRDFDCPYIIERMKRLHISVGMLSPLGSVYIDSGGFAHIKGRIIFDTWRGFKKTLTHERESNKLGDVAKDLFGVGKVEHGGIDDMWLNNLNLLIKYNVQDVFLEYAIGVTQNVFRFFYDVKCYSGCHYSDVLNNSRIVDAYFLFKAKERKIVLPSKRYRKKRKKKMIGAKVLVAPKIGIQYWIMVLDLKSLYPMCMITLNMGEDTIVYNPKPEEIPNLIKSPIKGVYFRKDKKSFVVDILFELIDYRAELQAMQTKYEKSGDETNAGIYKRLQTVAKFITNSIFGVMGYIKFRLFNKKIFENTTVTGQIVLGYTIDICEMLGYEVYYGDTDSVFLVCKSKEQHAAVKEMKDLAAKINKKYDIFKEIFNVDEHYFLIKGEKIYKTFFMTRLKSGDRVAKKRYAGNMVWNDKAGFIDKMDIVGFDRSDMSRVGNDVMKNVLKMACNNVDIHQIINYIQIELWKIKHKHYSVEEIGLSKGIRQPLNTYGKPDGHGGRKGVPSQIKAAQWTNQYSGLWGTQTNYGDGSKPKYVYVKSSQMPAPYHRTDMIATDENFKLPDHLVEILDYDTIIEKTVKSALETILEAIGIEWHTLVSKVKVKKLLGGRRNVKTLQIQKV